MARWAAGLNQVHRMGNAHFDDMALWRAVGPRSTYGTGTRNVATGDLDGDGKGRSFS